MVSSSASLAKEPLLLLVHRIPFPPNKGDKIRSYHLLEALRQKYDVRLGCFIDDENDWQYVDTLRSRVVELKSLPLHSTLGKLKSITAFATGQAQSLPYYRSAAMQRWVNKQRDCKKVVIFSSTMAQYVEHWSDCTRVADFVDVDSDKWAQYAESKRWPVSALYRRESRKLLGFETKIASSFTATAFVTAAETALFAQLAPAAAKRLMTVSNGVDTEFFAPQKKLKSPFPEASDQPVVVFTGAMDYWANADAVTWFARKLWPLVQKKLPSALFYIVGGNPSDQVKKLAELEGITVTGRVDDVRPYVQLAAVSIAPLRIARGVQNKVIEALALEKPVIASPQAAEGLAGEAESVAGLTVVSNNNLEGWCDAVVAELNAPSTNPGGRRYVLDHYNWATNLRGLLDKLESLSEHEHHEVAV